MWHGHVEIKDGADSAKACVRLVRERNGSCRQAKEGLAERCVCRQASPES